MFIRPATADDAEKLAKVHVESWRAAYREQLPDGYLDSLAAEDRVPLWRRVIAATDWPMRGTLVLDDEHETVGFAYLVPSRDDDVAQQTGEIASIYLDPGVWRRGGGRLLLTAAMACLRAARFREATLWVLETNGGPRQFYEVMGWVPDGARKTVEIDGLPLVEVRYRITL